MARLNSIIKRLKAKQESGSSLLEVIIAIVILGVVGSSLLGGLNSSTLTVRKTAAVIYASNQLQQAADSLKRDIVFLGCDKNTPDPYTSHFGKELNINGGTIKIIAISSRTLYVATASQTLYAPCSTRANASDDTQMITLQYSSPTGVVQQTQVVKTIFDNATGTSLVTTDFRMVPANNGVVEVVAGSSVTFTVNATQPDLVTPFVGDLTWVDAGSPLPGKITIAESPNANGSSATVTVTATTAANSGSVSVDYRTTIKAFDLNTNYWSKLSPNNLTIRVYPALTISNTDANLTAMSSCGWIDSAQGATSSACGTKDIRVTLAGGYGDEAFTANSTSYGPYSIVTSGSAKPSGTCTTRSACVRFNTASSTTGSQSPMSFLVTGSKLQGTVTLAASYSALSRPTLDFTSAPTTVKCVGTATGTTFLSKFPTSEGSACYVDVFSLPGTGSTVSSLTGMAAPSGIVDKTVLTGSNIYSSSYDAATDTYTVRVYIKTYNGTSSLCRNNGNWLSTGTVDSSKQIGAIKDPRQSGTTIPIYAKVTC